MTNFQKAFCVVLSMCFFATLAMLPGALFTGENVYRHLPLYRFLEKKTQVHSYEDQETYEKIAGENGKYLGERAKSEQMEAKEEANSLMTLFDVFFISHPMEYNPTHPEYSCKQDE